MMDGDLDSRARELIDVARDAHEPTTANRAHVQWRVERRVLQELNASPKRSWRRVLSFGLVSGALAMAGTATALLWQGFLGPSESAEAPGVEDSTRGETGVARPASVPALDGAGSETVETEAPEEAPGELDLSPKAPAFQDRRQLARPKRSAAARPAPTRPSAKVPSLAAETQLIAEAQAATNRGQAEQALRSLERYDREHGGGVLSEERSAARILALCAASRTGEARTEAKRFLSRWPRSPQVASIQSSCARTSRP